MYSLNSKTSIPNTTMKTKTTHALAATFSTIVVLMSPMAFGQGNSANAPGQQKKSPIIPVGWIDAFPTVVQAGERTTLTWGINYPSAVYEIAEVDGNATIVPKEDVSVEVRVLGTGVTVHWQNGNWQWVPAEATLSFNGGSFQRVFYGTNPSVDPSNVVWQKSDVKSGQRIRFGGRYFWNNQWGPTFTSDNGTQNVRILTDGQLPPSYSGIQPDIPSVEDFIKPYLDGNGYIRIGPLDMIVLMELTHTDAQQNHEGYDMQDMVLLVTVKPKPKNNNRSGLGDGTNPGQGNQMGNNDGTNNPNQANK